MLIGSFLTSGLNYLFFLVVARLLTPAKLGEVVAILSLTFLISIPAEVLITILARHVAAAKAAKLRDSLSSLYRTGLVYSSIFGSGMWVLFLLASLFLSSALRIQPLPLMIFAFLLPVMLLAQLNRGILQGLAEFRAFALVPVVAAGFKLGLAVLAIKLGLSVAGVITAVVVGWGSAYFYGRDKLQSLLARLQPAASVPKLKISVGYTGIVTVATLLSAAFVSLDMLLVKHYLSAYLAGLYAALVTGGKIISQSSFAFIDVMFPKVAAETATRKRGGQKALRSTLKIVAALGLFVTSLFWLWPELILRLLVGSQYLEGASFLGWFGVAALFTALSQVYINYFLAVQAKTFLVPLAGALVLRILLISLFHQSLFAVVLSVLASSVLLLGGMLGVRQFQE